MSRLDRVYFNMEKRYRCAAVFGSPHAQRRPSDRLSLVVRISPRRARTARFPRLTRELVASEVFWACFARQRWMRASREVERALPRHGRSGAGGGAAGTNGRIFTGASGAGVACAAHRAVVARGRVQAGVMRLYRQWMEEAVLLSSGRETGTRTRPIGGGPSSGKRRHMCQTKRPVEPQRRLTRAPDEAKQVRLRAGP